MCRILLQLLLLLCPGANAHRLQVALLELLQLERARICAPSAQLKKIRSSSPTGLLLCFPANAHRLQFLEAAAARSRVGICAPSAPLQDH
jgi:hypothetical protein